MLCGFLRLIRGELNTETSGKVWELMAFGFWV